MRLLVLCSLLTALSAVELPPQAPDFSHAGFHGGDVAIPDLPVTANVRTYGAIGDGVADDTAAINKALAEAAPGTVLVPTGRYRITEQLRITRSGVVLRGEGASRSILWFPRTLTDVTPAWTANTSGLRTSSYSWSGGFLVIGSQQASLATSISAITQPTMRGDTHVTVAALGDLKLGDDIIITLEDDDARSLTRYLYADDSGPISALKPLRSRQLARITGITGSTIALDRPLRYALRSAWQPRLARYTPAVHDSGIEDLGLAFPATPYGGHFTELGANGVELRGNAADCWVRRITLTNADSGVFVQGDRNTIADVAFEADRKPCATLYGGVACVGHHGLTTNGSDNLVSGFAFHVSYIHDLTVEGGTSAGNVFAHGSAPALAIDHHKKAPHANLFTDLDCGTGQRVWFHGGGNNLGKPSGTWETFWNLRATQPIALASGDWGPPGAIFKGLNTPVEPLDLHAAQLAARRAH